ncbi:MAG: FG-GAP repeat protein, partial [Phycisphaerales bacterium]|nr:FG-GAP repeat protein [Phycisphaerales bacterium]
DLAGTIGFRLDGISAGDYSGESVASAGDVNGDGVDDLIIGAIYGDPGGRRNAGETYVVFGRSDGFPASLGPDDLDGTNGFRIAGVAASDKSGTAVAGAGDLNGDGVEDLVIGATDTNGDSARLRGGAYVVFGSRDGFDPVVSLADLDGSNGFELAGTGLDGLLGGSVSAAGDLNGDGVDDAIVGARFSSPGGVRDAGAAYVVFGSEDGFPAILPTDQLDGTNGVALNGAAPDDFAGYAVSRAGDLNGDGIYDVAVGAAYAGDIGEGFRAQGYAYVVFGRSVGFPAAIDLGDLDGADGFRMEGATNTDGAGRSLAGGGDLNGDGFDDLVVGAPGTGYQYACYYCGDYGTPDGSAFVIYGRDSFDAVVELADVSADSVVRFDGPSESQMASSISGMTDFNADGRPDFLLGAIDGFGPISQGPGAGMVIYGRSPAEPCAADLDGDGELTIFDFLGFQIFFDIMDPRADFDGDGDFTIFDFLAFQTAFDAGC